METTRHNAYNSTRGTVLNAKLAVADRELEPLKFLELLIGGLGLDSESGVWLKPLASAPHVPRVFPFDLVYLDQNEKVVQAAEIFPTGEFPPFSGDVVSALILPLHATSSTQTEVGDQLLIEVTEEATESAAAVPDQFALASQDPAVQTIEVASNSAGEPVQLAASRVPAEVAASFSEAPAQAKPAGTVQSRPLTESPLTPTVQAPYAMRNWELPMEGFWAPQTSAPEPPAETRRDSNEAKQAAKVFIPSPPPLATPIAPIAAQTTTSASSPIGAKTTASPSNSTIQSVGPTISQYKSWQVSTSTAPTQGFNGQKASDRRSASKDSPDPTRTVAKADSRKKPAERLLRTSQLAQSVSEAFVKRETEPRRPAAESPQKTLLSGRPAVNAEEMRGDPVKVPAPAPAIPEIRKVEEDAPATSANSPLTVPPASKRPEPPLPLWKASPATASPSTREAPEKPRRIIDSVPQIDSTNRVERSKAPTPAQAKKPATRSLVEEAAELSSHVPVALSRLMAAIHRIGGAHPESKQAARPKGSAPNKISSWLNPEALHRDRRRAVRRLVPGMVAFYFTGGAPQPYTVADISATGFYLLTRDQWMPETMIQMTLQKPVAEGKQRKESLTVLTRIVRRGDDGIGAEFVMPEALDPHNRDIKPGRATDRMALARFLFSDQFPDSFEVLGCFITPQVEQPAGASVRVFQYGDSNLD